MGEQFERKIIELKQDKLDGLIELVYRPGLANVNIFIWHKDGDKPWKIIGDNQNQAGRILIGKAKDLKGDAIEVSFEVKNDSESDTVKFRLSGHLDDRFDQIADTRHQFEDNYKGEIAVRAIRWVFS
jgi:hypothetical protein